MRGFALIPAVLVLAAFAGCAAEGPAEEGFRVIHVDDLAGQLASKRPPVVLDANHDDFRAREGVLAGAVLLSSYNRYDVAKELPAAKDTPLVFYCADPH